MRSAALSDSCTEPTIPTSIEPGDRVKTLTSLTGTVLALWEDYAWLAIDTIGDDQFASTHKIEWLEPLVETEAGGLPFTEIH